MRDSTLYDLWISKQDAKNSLHTTDTTSVADEFCFFYRHSNGKCPSW